MYVLKQIVVICQYKTVHPQASVVLTPALLMAADSGCLLSLPLTGKKLMEDPTLQATPGAYDYQAYSDEEDYSDWYFITAANGLVVEAHEYGLFLPGTAGITRCLRLCRPRPANSLY